MGQFKSSKQIFPKFVDQIDLEVKVKDTSFKKSPRPLDDQYTVPSSKVVAFTRSHTKFLGFKANFTLKVKVISFQTHLKHLDA